MVLHKDGAQMRKLTAHNIRPHRHHARYQYQPQTVIPCTKADAGHESIDTTSQLFATSQIERHESAFNKPIDHLKGMEVIELVLRFVEKTALFTTIARPTQLRCVYYVKCGYRD